MQTERKFIQSETENSVASYIAKNNGFWTFGAVGSSPYSHFFRLLHDGRVGGYINENESLWYIEQDHLVIADRAGRPTTRFETVEVDPSGGFRLLGKFVPNPEVGLAHYLQPFADPYSLAQDPKKIKLDKHFSGQKRKNLVIMGANEHSLHHDWEQNITNEERNWDLCVSFYGDPQNYPPPGPVEYTSLQTGVRKWLAIHAAMYEDSPLWDYERIFILDDDIRTTWKDINEFLEICQTYELMLAQPSLKPGCFITHSITEQKPGNIIRFTTFVEAMAPCFTSKALRECLSITQGGFYGFGIDHLWPTILGLPRDKIGIVDAVAVEHTRSIGTTYNLGFADIEEKQLFDLYKVSVDVVPRVVGYVPSVKDKIVLVDVGASGGLQKKWSDIHDKILPVMFEPNAAEAHRLRNDLMNYPGAVVVETGLSDVAGARNINITEHFGCVSLLNPNQEFLNDYSIAPLFRVKETTSVECVRYDALYQNKKVPAPDVIKIDVQGFEYEVLQGFGSLLDDCLAIELEAHFYELYENQHLLGDLIKLLQGYGFVLRTIQPVDHFDGDCVEVDAIFTKNRAYVRSRDEGVKAKFTLITQTLGLPPY